ncbi:MAG: pitrilysin family protein [Planctomycetota bacterium]
MSRNGTRFIFAAWVFACLPLGVRGEDIPKHPTEIQFPPLDYKLPPASQFRQTLSNGMIVYVAEDRMLPTFDMTITVRVAAALDPPEKAGRAGLAAEQLRDGGTERLAPADFDEEIEFLAANIGSSMDDTSGTIRLSCLSKDIDAALALMNEMLRKPRYDEDRLRLAKERNIQNTKRRNDSTDSISNIEWGFQMNGEDHFSNRYPSSATINTITRDDLIAFHKRYYHPGNMMVAVAGDFDKGEMTKKLEKAFADWPVGETGPTTFPKPTFEPKAGIYMIHKPDVNQGRVTLGHKAIMRGTPDEFALQVMNSILGGGAFRSRLVAKVRSDEGLAYNVGSQFGQGVYYPGDFRCWFQSKSNSCAYATRMVLEEVKRMRDEAPSKVDVDDAVTSIVESFPQRFQTKMALLGTYVNDEYTGRDPKYWQTYVENIKKVTPQDVQRVAKTHLHPDRLVVLTVGNADDVRAGGHDKAPTLKFDEFGTITTLPLRDPDTLRR